METNEGREFVTRVVTNFLNKNTIKRYSRYISRGAAVAEKNVGTTKNLIELLHFQKLVGNWVDETNSVTKISPKSKHCPIGLTPTRASSLKSKILVTIGFWEYME